jgi:hypothetical protein
MVSRWVLRPTGNNPIMGTSVTATIPRANTVSISVNATVFRVARFLFVGGGMV